MKQIDVKSCALAFGCTWAAFVFFHGLCVWLFGWGTELQAVVSSLYIGFSPGLLGSVIGAIWGFLDGAIFGALAAWIYNKSKG